MKKLIGLLAGLLLVLLVVTAGAEVVSGTFEDDGAPGISWSIDKSTGEMNISGTGGIPYYRDWNSPWYPPYEEYKLLVKTLNIGSGITSIGGYAFEDFSNLVSVNCAESVEKIHDCSFEGCNHLLSIQLSEKTSAIGEKAFSGCSSLRTINIPGTIVSIGNDAFRGCSSLKSIVVYGDIGSKAFYESGITSITINNCSTIGDSAFENCKYLSEVNICEGITTIPEKMMIGCVNLRKVNIPSSVTSIGNEAFNTCESLTSVSLPEGLLSIADYAFSGSGLSSIVVPDSVNIMGQYVFNRCKNLVSITLPASISTIPNGTLNKCSSLLSLTIHEGPLVIGESAFEECTSLQKVTIPGSVVAINDKAFNNCSMLSSVEIPESVTDIGEQVFCCCNKLISVSLPSKLKIISSWCFYDSGLTEISIPLSVVSVGNNAFEGTPLKKVNYAGTPDEWKAINIQDNNGPLTDAFYFPTSIALSASSLSVYPEETKTLTLVYEPDYATFTYEWDSTGSRLIKVSASEKGDELYIEGLEEGTCILTVTTKNGLEAKCEIKVLPPLPTSIEWDDFFNYTFTMKEGDTDSRAAGSIVIYPYNADQTVTWTSGDEAVATVSESGIITAVGVGTVDITATTINGLSVVATVTVISDSIQPTSIDLDFYMETLVVGNTGTVYYQIEPEDSKYVLTWSSDDETVAKVDQNGIVTAVGPGKTRIRVSTDNGLKDDCSVTVVDSSEIRIDYSNFPDYDFNDYVSTYCDTDGNGYLSETEIATVTKISCSKQEIRDLKGIEYFTALVSLDCSENQLTALDLSKNTALVELHCNNNKITELDLTKNVSLNILKVDDNNLTSLDVSKLTDLMLLSCSNNRLTELNISNNPSLVFLACDNNKISELDVMQCSKLVNTIKSNNPVDMGSYWKYGQDESGNGYIHVDKSTNVIYEEAPEIGEVFTLSGLNYKVTAEDSASFIGMKKAGSSKSVVIPSVVTYKNADLKITEIASKAFYGDAKLTTVTIGDKVTVIGKNAFGSCKTLKTVKGGAAVKTIADSAFNGDKALATFPDMKNSTGIGASAFQNCVKLKTFTIGAKVTSIGNKAFYGCTALKTVKGGAAVKSIGNSAFYGDKVLASFPVMANLQKIGDSAFQKCVKLKAFTIGAKVSAVGKNAFNGCSALKDITVKSTKLTTTSKVKANAFKGINKKAKFTVPKSKLKKYKSIFVKQGAAKTCSFVGK